VIPVFLLVMISLITLYLLAGQFASFVVTSDITTHLRSMEAADRAIVRHLSAHISGSGKLEPEMLGEARPRRPEWVRRPSVRMVSEPSTAVLFRTGGDKRL